MFLILKGKIQSSFPLLSAQPILSCPDGHFVQVFVFSAPFPASYTFVWPLRSPPQPPLLSAFTWPLPSFQLCLLNASMTSWRGHTWFSSFLSDMFFLASLRLILLHPTFNFQLPLCILFLYYAGETWFLSSSLLAWVRVLYPCIQLALLLTSPGCLTHNSNLVGLKLFHLLPELCLAFFHYYLTLQIVYILLRWEICASFISSAVPFSNPLKQPSTLLSVENLDLSSSFHFSCC